MNCEAYISINHLLYNRQIWPQLAKKHSLNTDVSHLGSLGQAWESPGIPLSDWLVRSDRLFLAMGFPEKKHEALVVVVVKHHGKSQK